MPLILPRQSLKQRKRLTEKVPQRLLHELALGEQALILKDKLKVPRVIDDHAWRQAGHRDLEGLVAELPLTFGEPREELRQRLDEQEPIAD